MMTTSTTNYLPQEVYKYTSLSKQLKEHYILNGSRKHLGWTSSVLAAYWYFGSGTKRGS